MPRLSNDTMLKRAIDPAINDRTSLLECYENDNPDIEKEIAELEQLRMDVGLGKSFKELDRDTVQKAFLYTDQYLHSYLESVRRTTYERSARQEWRLMHIRRLELFGKSKFEIAVDEQKSYTIEELREMYPHGNLTPNLP